MRRDGEKRRAFLPDLRLEYSVISNEVDGMVFYGIEIVAIGRDETVSDRACLRELSGDVEVTERIIDILERFAVTPCAAAGVADDILAEEAIERAIRQIAN